MRKITNSDELTKVYGKINEFIDDYVKGYNITPVEIYRYISKNMDRFLEKYKLSNIQRIKTIVQDVIEHRKNMEKDKVFRFGELHKNLNESVIDFGSSNIDHEKVLADFYNTSVGHVNCIDSKLHLFEIKSFDEIIKCCAFSEIELQNIKNEFMKGVIETLYLTPIFVDSVYGEKLSIPLNIQLSDLVEESEIKTPQLNDKLTLRNIGGYISKKVTEKYGTVSVFYRGLPNVHSNYYIWEIRN